MTRQQQCTFRFKMFWRENWLILLVVALLTSDKFGLVARASSVNDCRGVRYAYQQKGLDQKDVPRQPRQGKTI